ncbi:MULTISPECIES: hypothetical protein [Rhodococcus]|uniref:hypothetical protein n=1 Tax=Rhodococcus TaxID=1827 RepID=UPI00193C276E|nr:MULTISPECIES: hypothetical protein [Rhodococcus]QRI79193.1 hypothetical protein JQ505_09105 [Rhodococcus aetherivorans]QSE62401.1 hypothetical protein JYA75_10215 [Rhodococcus sp. PSBB066]QSE72183.1 hypothetical protein JYA91_17375 [Rhodococcus sp. PSBB049]
MTSGASPRVGDRAWTLLDQEWTPGGDEVTATMKLRRRVIADKYASVIDRLCFAVT